MREILFRGKRIDNGKWVYGAFCQHDWADDDESRGVTEKPSIIDYNNELRWTYVIPSSVGQFTGLTDKNGTKIFEGDILAFSDRLVYVTWNKHYGCWDCKFFKSIDGEKTMTDHRKPDMWKIFSEIIGNIHDHPELMEGGAK